MTDHVRPLVSDPVYAAGGLRMMARHLGDNISPSADPDRAEEVARVMTGLVDDAVTLAGPDWQDVLLQQKVIHLLAMAVSTRRLHDEMRRAAS